MSNDQDPPPPSPRMSDLLACFPRPVAEAFAVFPRHLRTPEQDAVLEAHRARLENGEDAATVLLEQTRADLFALAAALPQGDAATEALRRCCRDLDAALGILARRNAEDAEARAATR